MLTLFTDGSSVHGNPGSTGAAYVIMRDGKLLKARGFPTGHGTNNRSEMLAAVHGMREALGVLTKGEDLLLVTDSQYLIGGLRDCESYIRRRAPNYQTWTTLYKLLVRLGANGGKCLVYWVRGHEGTHGNLLCDRMANKAATDGIDYVPVQKTKEK